jgi:DNA-binding SARP family transcriptional activator
MSDGSRLSRKGFVMMQCRVYLLGDPYVRVDQQTVAFKRKKALALLAYLALQPGQQCRRERLLDVLWPDQDEEIARAGLRGTLAALTETPLD